MRREIKFRVWNIVNNEFDDSNSEGSGCYLISLDGSLKDGNGKSYDEYHIIQQFTGFQDQTGRDIYEGDIIRYRLGSPYQSIAAVTWYDIFGCWGLFTKSKQELCHAHDTEVIGNILENPELIR